MIAEIIPLPRPVPPILAVGAFLKNTICVTRGSEALVSPVHGDLSTPEAVAAFEASVDALLRVMGAPPERVAHDLHPDFYSTRFAHSLDLPAVPVQHHVAHGAAIAAEHGHQGPLLAVSLDGFGLGPRQESWGGELLALEGASWRRLGHFAPLAQPGGDVAAREPWRMAAAILHRLKRDDEIATRFADIPAATRLARVLDRNFNCPPTSSAGRLFDAACGLLGLHLVARFEGQAPMALEALVSAPEVMVDGWRIDDGVLDFLPLLDRLSGYGDAARGADLFHGTLAAGLAEWVTQAAAETGIRVVALGGGCFLNKVLTSRLVEVLEAQGLMPLTARRLSPGDAGLCVGQAWIAAQT